MDIETICEYYKDDLLQAEDMMRRSLRGVAPLLSAVGEYIYSSGGKRIRPLLAIICSRLSGYRGEKTSILACSIESIHTASLLHDDVVDDAEMRRGRAVAHEIWGNHVAVLVGDFFYSNALRLANSLGNQKIMDILSAATARMAENELLQLTLKGNTDITEDEYMEIITGKTAILMSAATHSGAILGGMNREREDRLRDFGMKFGIAFQITDDILDYMADEKALGKTLGKDLEEGKITLPLIYLLSDAGQDEVDDIKTIIRDKTLSLSDLRYIVSLLDRYGAIKKSYEKVKAFIDSAKAEIELLENSREKMALLSLADYLLERRR